MLCLWAPVHRITLPSWKTPVNAAVMGEKLAVIEFPAARRYGVGVGIFVTAFPLPVGGLHGRAAASTDLKQDQIKQARDAKDNSNYAPLTDACLLV